LTTLPVVRPDNADSGVTLDECSSSSQVMISSPWVEQ
jgi:hypothetical protein